MSGSSTSLLDAILARTRERIRASGYPTPPRKCGPPRGDRFLAALREPGVRVIAEIKKRSPSAGEILPNAEKKIESFALAYRRGHAAAISVVTEGEFFGGEAEWIERSRRISGLPVLMKDFILEEQQLDYAAAHGADAVLLILAILDDSGFLRLLRGAQERSLQVLAEAHTEGEIDRAVRAGAEIIGVNARDLGTFSVDRSALPRLAAAIPSGRVRVAESGIASRSDVEELGQAGFGAFLVGEALLRASEPERKLRELRGER